MAMEDLFAQVLVLAARAGLGNLGLIALDGTKIAANASKDANRSERRLRELARQILAGAEAVDAAEDELYGDARGDELPPELADPVTRRDRIRKALADLEAERMAAREQQEQQASDYLARPPAGGVPVVAAVAVAERALERTVAAQQAKIARWQERSARAQEAGGRGAAGKAPVLPQEHCRVKRAQARLEAAKARVSRAERKAAARAGRGPVRNVTDPDSRLMPVRGGGFIQGYNAQAMHSADGLCLGTLVTAETTDYASLTPMIAKAQTAQDLLRARARGPLHRKKARIGTLLADAGYCSEANLTCPGPDLLIATGKRRDLEKAAHGGSAGEDAARQPRTAAMATRLTQPHNILAYRQRGPIAETPFGNAKHNRGFRRFSPRGLRRVTGEWAFENTIANLLKIHATAKRPALA